MMSQFDDSEEYRAVVDSEWVVGNDGERGDNCTRFNEVHHRVGEDFILERAHRTEEVDVINDGVHW